MGRFKEESEINEFLLMVLKENELLKDGRVSIKKAAEETGLHFTSLRNISHPDYSSKILEFHIRAAKAFGVPLDQWILGITGNTTEGHKSS